MNAKIKKVIQEINVVEQKISEFKQKLKNLKEEQTNLENIEIIGMFRNAKITTYEIADVMKSFKEFHYKNNISNLNIVKETEDRFNEKN